MAALTTDAFAAAGQRHAKTLGIQDLPIITVPHPIEFASRQQVEERAGQIVDETAYVLTTAAERLGEEYRGKHTRQHVVRSSVPA
ncbi:MAG: hypothetical protein ABIH46_08665 [Chloroflexota bacterium]